ncbi:MAG: condensation domain-containing protein, partial [Cyanobacteria bacterium P01_F01_bin.143]
MESISKRISNLSPAKKKLLELRMKQQKAKNQQLKQELKPIPRTEKLPLSLIQQGIWDIEQLQPGKSSFNLPISCRLVGDLNQEILVKSINEIVKRHEALRTCFYSENKQQFQKTLPNISLSLPIIDLRAIDSEERIIAQQKIAFEEASQPFDLEKAPLLRVKLLILQEQEHLLLVTMHHGVADIWSLGIFLQELPIIYQAFLTDKPYILPELPIQYADFVYWQKQSLQ